MNGTQRSTDELTTDPAYQSLKGHVIQATGLTYYIDKDDDLARRLQRRFSSLGLGDCGAYLELLKEPQRGRYELDQLIAEITIGETYFFRHQEHFDALRDTVPPDLLARNHGNRSLRIWCAGCADGTEAYSLAILLGRYGSPTGRLESKHPRHRHQPQFAGTRESQHQISVQLKAMAAKMVGVEQEAERAVRLLTRKLWPRDGSREAHGMMARLQGAPEAGFRRLFQWIRFSQARSIPS